MARKLFDLAAISALAADESTTLHSVSPGTRQALLACFGLLADTENWRDYDETLSASEVDDIDALVSKAMEEIIEPMTLNPLKLRFHQTVTKEITSTSYEPCFDLSLGTGTLSLSTDFWQPGASVNLSIHGRLRCSAQASNDIEFAVLLGGTPIVTVPATSITAGTSRYFKIDLDLWNSGPGDYESMCAGFFEIRASGGTLNNIQAVNLYTLDPFDPIFVDNIINLSVQGRWLTNTGAPSLYVYKARVTDYGTPD